LVLDCISVESGGETHFYAIGKLFFPGDFGSDSSLNADVIIGARGAITFGGTEALLSSSNAPVGFMKAVGRTAGGYTVVVEIVDNASAAVAFPH
jgi:hypothetical protein